jgi:hypothetical protein
MLGIASCAHKRRPSEQVHALDPKPSTARDDAPNVDKLNLFEGDPGDRVALVPFCPAAGGTLLA